MRGKSSPKKEIDLCKQKKKNLENEIGNWREETNQQRGFLTDIRKVCCNKYLVQVVLPIYLNLPNNE